MRFRELEMGNDDLERTERAVSSSLADVEAKYARVLEEKILLEHELLDKANIEEECQRLKDQLSGKGTICLIIHLREFISPLFCADANIENEVLKDRMGKLKIRQSTLESVSTSAPSSAMPHVSDSLERIKDVIPPSDLQLSELGPKLDRRASTLSTTSASSLSRATEPTPASTRQTSSVDLPSEIRSAGLPTSFENLRSVPNPEIKSLTRSNTLHTWSPSRLPQQTTLHRAPLTNRNTADLIKGGASTSTSVLAGSTSKSKGVQMVSEMRARVRNLEQKLHTRVPRLRMGSITGRNVAVTNGIASGGSSGQTSPKRRPAELLGKPNDKEKTTSDSSGWVLIMEDSSTPTPVKDTASRDRRRLSSPSPAGSVGPSHMSSRLERSSYDSPSNVSAPRPLQSRLSASIAPGSNSSRATPTRISRPSTPTFLPVPTSSLNTYGHGASASARLTMAQKRSSLGASTPPSALKPPQDRIRERPSSSMSNYLGQSTRKALPATPAPNVTVRTQRHTPGPKNTNLAQSRIGRPTPLGGRRSTGADEDIPPLPTKNPRSRSDSTAALGGGR